MSRELVRDLLLACALAAVAGIAANWSMVLAIRAIELAAAIVLLAHAAKHLRVGERHAGFAMLLFGLSIAILAATSGKPPEPVSMPAGGQRGALKLLGFACLIGGLLFRRASTRGDANG